MTDNLNELRAKAAAWDESVAKIDAMSRGKNGRRRLRFCLELQEMTRLLDEHRQRLNVSPDPQLDNDYEPVNRDELVLVKKGSVLSWMEQVGWDDATTAVDPATSHRSYRRDRFDDYYTVPLFRLSTDETTEDK